MPVPRGFSEAVKNAAQAEDVAELSLLAAEASGLPWEVGAWREVGRALFNLDAHAAAKRTWERVRQVDPFDLEANHRLGADPTSFARAARHQPEHIMVFTGHRIDAPGRKEARFPESCVGSARAAIRDKVESLKPDLGIAAAASGGDILFHEVCAEFGIPTRIRLVMPEQQFEQQSVADGGRHWTETFWKLVRERRSDCKVLSETDRLPDWLNLKPAYSVWQRANQWMLEEAIALNSDRLTVLALWNGREGDGLGGTKDLLEQAKAIGATAVVIDTKSLCGTEPGTKSGNR